MTALAASRPRVDGYLASLPEGLASYPLYLVRAGVLHQLLDVAPSLRERAHTYPGPLRELVQTPPPGSEWIPEVHLNALFLIHRDECCESDDDFIAVAREMNRRVLSSGALLFRVVSPRLLCYGARSRWHAWHHGVDLRVNGISTKGAQLAMVYPASLLPAVVARGYATAFAVAAALAGGQDVRIELMSHDECAARFTASWR